MKLRAPLLLLCLVLTAALLGGCSLFGSAPPSVVSVAATDQVDAKTMAPLNPADRFPKSVKLIYSSVLIKNGQKGTKVEATWMFDKEGKGAFQPVDAAAVTFPDARKGDTYVAFSLKPETTFYPGTYKVEISLDGKPAKKLTFTISE